MAADGFKQTPHSPGCYLAAQGREEYIVLAKPYYLRYADKLGRVYKDGRGRTHLAFVCNDPSCTSEVWVRWDKIMAWIAEGIATPHTTTETEG
jgi:hypothetical protein